jgi:hypothetical protein
MRLIQKLEKNGPYKSTVCIVIKPLLYPDDGHRDKIITATQVYEWLREGTRGGGHYWFYNEEAERPTAHNYPTPAHLFEMHTSLQIKGWLNSLSVKDIAKNKKI